MRLARYLAEDHDRCDDLFERSQKEVLERRWDQAAASFAGFRKALERHLAMEEAVLFAAVESARCGPIGPTQQMRVEHLDMRDLIDEMAEAAERRDADDFAGSAETLRVLMRQHNLKEEQVLYPMVERILGADGARVLADMQRIEAPVG